MRLRRRHLLKDASGATAVEFALISPVLFMLIVGGFQTAWMLHCAATVRWALETNARTLMLNPAESATTLKSAIVSSLNGKASASDLNVTITQDTSHPNGTMLVATSTYSTSLAIPFMDPHAITFTSTTKVPSF